MSDLPESRRTGAGSRRGRLRPRYVLWGVLALVLLLVLAVAWVGVRGLLAARDLQQSVSLVSSLKAELNDGNAPAATKTAERLQNRAESARALTADPVWGAFQYLPVVGTNLRAVRQVAVIVDDIARGTAGPVVSVLNDVNADAFRPTDGKVNLQPLIDAQPAIAKAAITLEQANTAASAIETSNTLPTIEDAVNQLRDALSSVLGEAGVADKLVQLAPAMLGSDGARDYLLLFQNNAEVRAGGGIPGAVALLHADHGNIQLASQAAGSSFGPYDSSVLPLESDTEGLYGAITGRYMQDVTLTPRFSTSAQLAREMWKREYGQEVNGVLAMDPVTLSYVLEATGPVQLPTGETLSSDNAVRMLLSDVYAKYPDPQVQDLFFAAAASTVFDKVSAGDFNPKQFLAAISKAAGENRLRIWSADEATQAELADTAISGDLPRSDASAQRFGVYLNDATGGKMDYYLDKTVAVGSQVCRKDGRPAWVVEVTVRNTAPADAATSLPEYVTGRGAFGVQPGSVQTNLAVYAPPSAVFTASTVDGQPASPQTTVDGRHPVAQLQTLLSPGQSTTIRIVFLGPASAANTAVDAVSTPGIHPSVTKTLETTCEDPLIAATQP